MEPCISLATENNHTLCRNKLFKDTMISVPNDDAKILFFFFSAENRKLKRFFVIPVFSFALKKGYFVVKKIPRRHEEHKVFTRRIFIAFVICDEICYLRSYNILIPQIS
jgi:hypothetical protein